jgi:hypothetical protein
MRQLERDWHYWLFDPASVDAHLKIVRFQLQTSRSSKYPVLGFACSSVHFAPSHAVSADW